MKILKPLAFIDLETTGTSIQSDYIVEIACMKIHNDETGTIEEKTMRLKPPIPIPKEASDVHGITDEMVKDCPRFIEISKGLLAFLDGCDLGGYNSDRFDIPMLIEEFTRCNIEFPTWNPNTVDVYKYETFLRPNTLAEVYKRYTGEELDGAHGALADVKGTFSVLMHQLDGNNDITPEEIDLLCQGDKKRFDFAGKAYINKDGVACWSFGKNVNKPIVDDPSYLQWVLGQRFPIETINKLKMLVKK